MYEIGKNYRGVNLQKSINIGSLNIGESIKHIESDILYKFVKISDKLFRCEPIETPKINASNKKLNALNCKDVLNILSLSKVAKSEKTHLTNRIEKRTFKKDLNPHGKQTSQKKANVLHKVDASIKNQIGANMYECNALESSLKKKRFYDKHKK